MMKYRITVEEICTREYPQAPGENRNVVYCQVLDNLNLPLMITAINTQEMQIPVSVKLD